MTIATLRSIERRLYALYRALEPLRNEPETKALFERSRDEWMKFYGLLKQRRLAQAAKRDQGVVLFTVFRPVHAHQAIEEVQRTSHRLLRRTGWKGWATGNLEPWKDFSGEVCGSFDTPERDFARLMKVEGAA